MVFLCFSGDFWAFLASLKGLLWNRFTFSRPLEGKPKMCLCYAYSVTNKKDQEPKS